MAKSDEQKQIEKLKKELAKSRKKEARTQIKLEASRKENKRLKEAKRRDDKKKEAMPKDLLSENQFIALIDQFRDMNTER